MWISEIDVNHPYFQKIGNHEEYKQNDLPLESLT